MFTAFERFIAFRYLRSRRSEGFISIIAAFSLIGITLGVATLIVVMSVMNGFRDELMSRILGINGHIAVYPTKLIETPDLDKLIIDLKSLQGVNQVIPIVEGQVMASSGRSATGALVRAFHGHDLQNLTIIKENIIDGSIKGFINNEGILVGQRFAERLGIVVGDRLGLVSPQTTATAFGSVPRSRGYVVAGIFNLGMFQYDNGFIFMPLKLAQLHFNLDESLSKIELSISEPNKVKEFRILVANKVGPLGSVIDWQQQHSHFVNALKVERNVMFVILALILIVAAFIIVSGLIMVVKDKSQDIAILRTMGATRGQVMRIFFINGVSIGILGTAIGTGIGILFASYIDSIRMWIEGWSGTELFAPEVRFLSELPVLISFQDVLVVVLMSIGLSFLATLYPAWRAARLDPVEALRYE
tara:strand:- start:7337 stop:8584 length:1248 start_codon:yes stop_codon:yes gene_type:complete